MVEGRAGGRAGVAQHPVLPFFQYQRKRATPSRMITVEPDRMTFMCPTWKPSKLIALIAALIREI